jgi:hypothetical protein
MTTRSNRSPLSDSRSTSAARTSSVREIFKVSIREF